MLRHDGSGFDESEEHGAICYRVRNNLVVHRNPRRDVYSVSSLFFLKKRKLCSHTRQNRKSELVPNKQGKSEN
jgi:hypothetical protein